MTAWSVIGKLSGSPFPSLDSALPCLAGGLSIASSGERPIITSTSSMYFPNCMMYREIHLEMTGEIQLLSLAVSFIYCRHVDSRNQPQPTHDGLRGRAARVIVGVSGTVQ